VAELVRDNFTGEKLETDYAVSEHTTALEGLKEKLSKLKEFKDSDSGKSLGSEEKEALELLVKNLGDKVEAMEKEAKKGSENTPTKDGSFLKS